MFKTRFLDFCRTVWQSCTQFAPGKSEQSLVSRMKRLNERTVIKEDVDIVADIYAGLRAMQTRTQRSLISTQTHEEGHGQQGLTHWCADAGQSRKNSSAVNQGAGKSHTFEIDPRVPIQGKSEQSNFESGPGIKFDSENTITVNSSADVRIESCSVLSEPACREILRIDLAKRGQISRSLSSFAASDEHHEPPETVLADCWNCTEYNSLFSLPDESQYGTTTEYEEDYEEELLPYFTETLLLQEQELAEQQAYSQMSGAPTGELPIAAPAIPEAKAEVQKQKPIVKAEHIEVQVLQPYKNFSENALKLIAQKPETPAPTLKWLASHVNPHIRAAVAKNVSTPGDTIIILAKDHEAGIRHSIAENPHSCTEALNLLIKDRNPLISWRAQNTLTQIKESQRAQVKATEKALAEAKNNLQLQNIGEAKIATTEETIAFLQVIARKTNTPVRRLAELTRHYDARIRAAVAGNANAPADILWALARDAEPSVKIKVTENYNCPVEILESLKEDEDAFVAYQAHTVLMRILGSAFGENQNHIRTGTWP